MGVIAWLQERLGRKAPEAEDPAALAREEAVRERVRERCRLFRRLLGANKRAMERIADIEERLAGGGTFGMSYVSASCAEVAANVFQMIRALNALSGDGHRDLAPAFDRIRARMEALLVPVWSGREGPFVLPLSQVGLADLSQVGGKMANLGEIASHVGLRIPAGFVVTVAGYRRFMECNNLGVELARCIQGGTMRTIEGLLSLSQQLQQKILRAPVPDDLRVQMEDAVREICAGHGADTLLAVRSSAVGEDGLGASFAGQYRTETNVHSEEVCDVWKEIVASKYATSALSYRYQRGIPDEDAPMGVGVMVMVDALAGGVAYSRDPLAENGAGDSIVVNAVRGVPAAVVDGRVTPDVHVCDRGSPPKHLSSTPADGKVPVLTPEQAVQVARIALALEEYYVQPQDVEWAFDQDGELVILQSRPLHAKESAPAEPVADGGASAAEAQSASGPDESAVLMRGGVPVSRGVAFGRAFVARKEADMLAFPEGAVLVTARAHPRWAALLPHASGMISENGGVAGHLASVAREYGVPALFGLPDACARLADAGEITLDAGAAAVYAGDQRPHLPRWEPAPSFMTGSPIWRRLQEISRHITPLNLLDPKSPGFAPDHCETMHDLTRFCHEKAVDILFSGEDGLDDHVGRQLKVGSSRLQYWLVDMGGGFARPVRGATVELADMASRPMLALWEGMVSVPWNGPPVAGAGGLMSVVLESAMNPELESMMASPMAERNFFIVGAGYMILQARYGYHFCTVECQAGEQAHENFLSFQFKGGAADRERRMLRLQLFAELLEERGFKVDVKEDALFAVAEDFDEDRILRLTRLLGYLLIHSRQSDVIMKDSARVSLFRSKLIRDMNHLDGLALRLKA